MVLIIPKDIKKVILLKFPFDSNYILSFVKSKTCFNLKPTLLY